MTLSTGTQLGPYVIVSAVGAGGMGEVYRARDTRLDRDVALKVLSSGLINSELARERFQREARTVAALHHPHICAVYDVGETPEHQGFIVMEFLQGETLDERLRKGPLDVPMVVDTAIALTEALAAAHAAGIVHRDIKPENVFLTPWGPKLLDFRYRQDGAQVAGADSATQTGTARPLTAEGGRCQHARVRVAGAAARRCSRQPTRAGLRRSGIQAEKRLPLSVRRRPRPDEACALLPRRARTALAAIGRRPYFSYSRRQRRSRQGNRGPRRFAGHRRSAADGTCGKGWRSSCSSQRSSA
jgi:hypothetical protein